MVRKRKGRRDSSDEEDEEDVDFSPAQVEAPPSPKPRYSFRQRKKQVIIDDYDYEDDDERNLIELHKSDGEYSAEEKESPDEEVDEDFSLRPKPKARGRRRGSSTSNSSRKQIAVKVDYGSGQPESVVEVVSAIPGGAAPEVDSDGPIDFEDIIRADIVVNKKRIDFENYIQRNEIEVPEVQPEEEDSEGGNKKNKKRRSRRPRKRCSYLEDDCTSLVEAQINEGTSNSDDIPLSLALLQKTVPDEVVVPPPDTNPQPLNLLPSQVNEIQNNSSITTGYLVYPHPAANGAAATPPVATPVILANPSTFPNGNALPVISSLSTVPPELPVSNNGADASKSVISPPKLTPAPTLAASPAKPNGGLISVKNLNELLDVGRLSSAKPDLKDCDSDSDVEIIEEKREIIVLDDDDD